MSSSSITPCPVRVSGSQMAAIIKMALTMAAADGVILPQERELLAYELSRFGVKPAQLDELFSQAMDMDANAAISEIAALPDDGKTYVAALLGSMMAIDREVDTTELALWQQTCSLCALPRMTLGEALDYMREG